MNISEVIGIIKAEVVFKRTPIGRSINEYGLENLNATLDDKDNYDIEAVQCKNCRMVQSSLLIPSGCPACGNKDMTTEFIV